MQEDKRLSYHSGRTTNMVQWKRDAAEYLAKSKDLSIFSKIMRSGTIPEELVTPYKVTQDPSKADSITLKLMEDEAIAHEKERRNFLKTKSMFISTILQDCLSNSSRHRLDAIALTELEDIKNNEDILTLITVIEKTHLYQGKEVTQGDVRQLTNMKTSFTYKQGETIQEYGVRFRDLCSYLEGTNAKFKDEEEKVFTFIDSLTKYSMSSAVRDTVVTWIADRSYPKNFKEVYTKLEGYHYAQNPVNIETEDSEKSVNSTVTIGKKIREEYKRSNQDCNNKSEKDKKSYNPHTFYLAKNILQMYPPGSEKTIEDIINDFKCNKCQGKKHIAADCRRNNQSDEKTEKTTKEDKNKVKNIKAVKVKKKKSKSESESDSSSSDDNEEDDAPPSKAKHMVSSTAVDYDELYSKLFYF